MEGLIPTFVEIKATSPIQPSAQRNALNTVPSWLPLKNPIPKTIDREAPNAAAFEIPIVKGLTIGLRVAACMAAPAEESPIPAMIAIAILGRRKSTMILSCLSKIFPPDVKARKMLPATSENVVSVVPRVVKKIARINIRIKPETMSRYFLCFLH